MGIVELEQHLKLVDREPQLLLMEVEILLKMDKVKKQCLPNLKYKMELQQLLIKVFHKHRVRPIMALQLLPQAIIMEQELQLKMAKMLMCFLQQIFLQMGLEIYPLMQQQQEVVQLLLNHSKVKLYQQPQQAYQQAKLILLVAMLMVPQILTPKSKQILYMPQQLLICMIQLTLKAIKLQQAKEPLNKYHQPQEIKLQLGQVLLLELRDKLPQPQAKQLVLAPQPLLLINKDQVQVQEMELEQPQLQDRIHHHLLQEILMLKLQLVRIQFKVKDPLVRNLLKMIRLMLWVEVMLLVLLVVVNLL